ncbi:MAG TPA: diguanylate cyclase [Candidatus Limnocylindrales bacterium]|nr:diguanylate cyclase [Candidatus Limnocylindrales bacterium]
MAGASGLLLVQALVRAPALRRRSPRLREAGHTLRLSAAVVFVAVSVQATSFDQARPLAALYLPAIALAAVYGARELAWIGGLAAILYFGPELARPEHFDETSLRAVGLTGAAVILAVGSRRTVSALERALLQVRAAASADRRRSRQLASVEAVGRVLAAEGPTAAALDEVMRLLSDGLGYRFVSIFLLDGALLRLGGQRGYTDLVPILDGTSGVLGRAMRTRELQFVADVTADPDYVAAAPEVRSEISAPLLSGHELLGVLNVESESRLDDSDARLVAAIADRLAAAVVLGRGRQELAERARLLASLHRFAADITAYLDPAGLHEAIVEGISEVVPADAVALTLLDRTSGGYRIAAVRGPDTTARGSEIRPGEGIAGRAIRERTTVVVGDFRREAFPAALRSATGPDDYTAAGVPLIREGVVLGALTLGRTDPQKGFSELEREVLELVASQAALAVANVQLHAELAELAVRDPLTGLSNRRHFDDAFARLMAGQGRRSLEERRVAAIIFDVDHFGQFNKQHGHQVGDAMLRCFSDVLRERFRASDLVARYGGEEFVVVLDDATPEEAGTAAEEVRARFAAAAVSGADGATVRATVSAGCSALGPDVTSGEALLRAADVALFMAKRSGRDRVVTA